MFSPPCFVITNIKFISKTCIACLQRAQGKGYNYLCVPYQTPRQHTQLTIFASHLLNNRNALTKCSHKTPWWKHIVWPVFLPPASAHHDTSQRPHRRPPRLPAKHRTEEGCFTHPLVFNQPCGSYIKQSYVFLQAVAVSATCKQDQEHITYHIKEIPS